MFRQAKKEDAPIIRSLLINAWNITYKELYSPNYIQRVIENFYSLERIIQDIEETSKEWSGYYVLTHNNKVVGCIAGGVDKYNIGEIYVLYLEPSLKRRGYGTSLVELYSKIQKNDYDVEEQRVVVTEGNDMALPFYKKIGFSEQGIIKSFFNEATDDYRSVVMLRRL